MDNNEKTIIELVKQEHNLAYELIRKEAQKEVREDLIKLKECCINDRVNHVAFNHLLEKYI